jgi:hypothetical protein
MNGNKKVGGGTQRMESAAIPAMNENHESKGGHPPYAPVNIAKTK